MAYGHFIMATPCRQRRPHHDAAGEEPPKPKAVPPQALQGFLGCHLLGQFIGQACRAVEDLGGVAARKLQKNAAKYPAALVKGSSKKYNEYAVNQNKEQGS